MSILIQGMDMPKNCAECKMWSICECLNDFEDFESICYAVEDGDLVRDKNCPLIELPPHGRLIDGDKFYKVMCSKWVLSLGEAYKRLDEFLENPVIEAEGSET